MTLSSISPAFTRAILGTLCILAPVPALADMPWEDWSRQQQAAIVYGYLQAPDTARCKTLRDTIALVSEKLQTKYEMTIDDVNERSPLGRAFVRKGRLAAKRDAAKRSICNSLEMDIDRATAELLMP